MTSREKILAAVKANQPSLRKLPLLEADGISTYEQPVAKFTEVVTAIGGRVFLVKGFDEIREKIGELFIIAGRMISSFKELADIAETDLPDADPHGLSDTDVAVLKADLGVAENGSMWVPETNMMQRILPFITQHLCLVVEDRHIVNNMHEAYKVLGNENPGFGAFIAGPSKTADIEQSLVLGAHGPRSLTVFLMNS